MAIVKLVHVPDDHFYVYYYFIENLWVRKFVWRYQIAEWFKERTGKLPRIDTNTQTVELPIELAAEYELTWS